MTPSIRANTGSSENESGHGLPLQEPDSRREACLWYAFFMYLKKSYSHGKMNGTECEHAAQRWRKWHRKLEYDMIFLFLTEGAKGLERCIVMQYMEKVASGSRR